MNRLLLLLLLLSAVAISGVCCFQSDELPEDADEWGLVGEAPPIIKSKVADNNKVEPERAETVTKKSSQPPAAAPGPRKISFPLEHALGDSGQFEQIGTFSGILRMSVHDSAQERQVITKLRLSRNPMSKAEKRSFEELVKNDGFYTIRIPANMIQPRKKQVMASVKARCLAAANLKERFDLFIDQGNLIGVGYSPIGDCSFPRPQIIPTDWTFETLIVAKGNEQAPRLGSRFSFEEAVPLRVGEKVVDGEDGVKVVVEKTFWQKYWMYIVPFAFIAINALSQIATMPEDAPPGQGGPAIAAPAPRAGGSGGGRTRR